MRCDEGAYYCFDVHVAVPPETDGFCAFGFLQTAEVEVEVLIVEVDRSNR